MMLIITLILGILLMSYYVNNTSNEWAGILGMAMFLFSIIYLVVQWLR